MNSSFFFAISEVSYMLAMIIYICYLAFRNHAVGWTATVVTIFGFVVQTSAFILRWVESYQAGFGHAPLTNLYESLVFFVWSLILGYLIVEFKYKNRSFGAFITPIAGLALAFIDLSGMNKDIQPLLPALQSNWLLVHVMMSFLSYAAFSISFSTGVMYLITTTREKKEPAYIFWTFMVGLVTILLTAMALDYIKFNAMSGSNEILIKKHLFKATFLSPSLSVVFLSIIGALGLLFLSWRFGYLLRNVLTYFKLSKELLEEITYKSIAVGFPVFTLGGLMFGAIWADQAWGVYWSWDPKETWSLITWIVYAVYLHARYMRGWRGKKVAVLSVIGFVSVIFTYLGVNLVLSGLHSYGSA